MKKVHLLLLFFLALLCCLYFYNNTEPFRLSNLEEKNNAGLNTCKGGLYCLDGELCDNYPGLYTSTPNRNDKYYLRKNIITNKDGQNPIYTMIARQCVDKTNNQLKECDDGETPEFILNNNIYLTNAQHDAEYKYAGEGSTCVVNTDYPNLKRFKGPNESRIKLKPNNVCIKKQLSTSNIGRDTYYFGELCNPYSPTDPDNNMNLTGDDKSNEFCGRFMMKGYSLDGEGDSQYDAFDGLFNISSSIFSQQIGDYQKSVPQMCNLLSEEDYKRQTDNFTLDAVADDIRNDSVYKNNKYFTTLCNLREDEFISAETAKEENILIQPGPWSKCIITNKQYNMDEIEGERYLDVYNVPISCDDDEIIIISIHPNSIFSSGMTGTTPPDFILYRDGEEVTRYHFQYNNNDDNFSIILPYINNRRSTELDMGNSGVQGDQGDPSTLDGLTLEQHVSNIANSHASNSSGFNGSFEFIYPDGVAPFLDFNVVINIKKIKITQLTDTVITSRPYKIQYFISLINMVINSYNEFIANVSKIDITKARLSDSGNNQDDNIDNEIINVFSSLFTNGVDSGDTDETIDTSASSIHPDSLDHLLSILIPDERISKHENIISEIDRYRRAHNIPNTGERNSQKIQIIRNISRIIIDLIKENSCYLIGRLSGYKQKFNKLLTNENPDADAETVSKLDTVLNRDATQLMTFLHNLNRTHSIRDNFNKTITDLIGTNVRTSTIATATNYIYSLIDGGGTLNPDNTDSLLCSTGFWTDSLRSKLNHISDGIQEKDPGDLNIEATRVNAKKDYIRTLINRGQHFGGGIVGTCDFSDESTTLSDSRTQDLKNCILNNIKEEMRSDCASLLLTNTEGNCYYNPGDTGAVGRCRTAIRSIQTDPSVGDNLKEALGYCDLDGRNHLWVDDIADCGNTNFGPQNYLTGN